MHQSFRLPEVFKKLESIALTLAVFVCLSPISGNAGAFDPNRNSKGQVGAKFGMIYSSQIKLDDATNDTRVGVSAGVFFDFPVAKNLFLGADIDLHDLQAFDLRKKWVNGMLVLKPTFPVPKQAMDFRCYAGAGIGYFSTFEYITPLDAPDSIPNFDVKLESTTMLVLKGGLELLFHYTRRTTFVVDLGSIYAPTDFDNKRRVRYGPTFFLRAGIAI